MRANTIRNTTYKLTGALTSTKPTVNGPRKPSSLSITMPRTSAPTIVTVMKQPAAPAMVATEMLEMRVDAGGSVIRIKVREYYHN